MATLYITEFASLNNDATAGGGVLLPKCPSLADQSMAITAGSTQSSPFTNNTRFVEIVTDAICSIKIGGANPVATVACHRMPAGGPPERYAVNPGDKIAVIVNT